MRKSILTYCVLYILSLSTFAQVPADYYASAQGKKGEALREALHGCIKNHEELNYDALEEYYGPTDFRPDSTLWDIYSKCEYYRSDAGGTQDDFCQHWNKEHTVCQSWFGGAAPMYSDIFHVLPTDARVNNLRSSYPYGETNERNDKISQGAPYALGHVGASTVMSGTTVYQPDDRYQGDIARIYFYMATCYRDKDFTKAEGGRTMFTYEGNIANLTGYSVNLLLKWHRNDPVSYKEIARNDSVYKVQHNRNPFVDYPELAEYIWGNRTSTAFDMGTVLSAYSKDYVPLDTEGSDRTDYDKFGVVWYANGIKIRTDSVFKSHKPSVLPATPVSCSTSSNTFMGWSAAFIAGKTQTAPTDLFKEILNAPAITEDRTFYAVFAHEQQGVGVGDVTATAEFSEAAGYKRSDKTEIKSATAGKVNIAFAKKDASTFAKFLSELRCYAGSTITLSGATITKVVFVPGKEDKGNAITAKVGTMNGLEWTGSASNIVFTIGGDNGYRGLKAITVTYDDNTTVFDYSDYLTSCDATDVSEEPLQPSETGRKYIRDGQLVIVVGEHEYNILGQTIK